MRVQGGTYSVKATGISTQSYLITGLVLGTTYDLTVEAQNSVGYSAPSDSVTFLHAIPPVAPVCTTTNSGTGVIIDWNSPTNNGAVITSYTVLIQQSDGVTYSEDTTNCDGSDSAIVSNT